MSSSNMVIAIDRWQGKLRDVTVREKLRRGGWNYATLDCKVGYFKVMLWYDMPEWEVSNNSGWKGEGRCEVGCEGHSVDVVEAEHTIWRLREGGMDVIWKLDTGLHWCVEGRVEGRVEECTEIVWM